MTAPLMVSELSILAVQFLEPLHVKNRQPHVRVSCARHI